MSDGWASDYVDADPASSAVVEAFRIALWERQMTGGPASGPTTPPDPLPIGTDVQSTSFWAGLQTQATGFYDDVYGGWFIRPGFNFDGAAAIRAGFLAPYRPIYRFAFWSQMGDPDPNADPGKPLKDAFNANLGRPHGYQRKRPREIASSDAIMDTQGNMAAEGHRAICLSGGTFPPIATGQVNPYPAPTLYRRTGGAWVPVADGEGPDTLVGEAGEERTITSVHATADTRGRPAEYLQIARGPGGAVYVYDEDYSGESESGYAWREDEDGNAPEVLPTSGSGVVFGVAQPGDYLGPWVLDELCKMIRGTGNRTFTKAISRDFDSEVYSHGTIATSMDARLSPTSWTATTVEEAYGQAAARWTPEHTNRLSGPPQPTSGGGPPQAAVVVTKYAPPGSPAKYFVEAIRVSYGNYVTTNNHRNRTVTRLTTYFTYPGGESSTTGDRFSGQGDTVGSAGTFGLWGTAEPMSAGGPTRTSVQTPAAMPGTSMPSSFSAETNFTGQGVTGYSTTTEAAVVEWTFQYG